MKKERGRENESEMHTVSREKKTYQNFSGENLKERKEVVAISEIFKQVPHITAGLKNKIVIINL